MPRQLLIICTAIFLFSCQSNSNKIAVARVNPEKPADVTFDTTTTTIHVFVALCDNKYQGIVPVPAKIGNGEDLDNNLYWGCAFGVRSYFKKSSSWQLVKQMPVDNIILERLVFKHRSKNFYLIADAYNGKNIKEATVDFLQSCAGDGKEAMTVNGKRIGISGNAKLLAYVGHDGLMDFQLTGTYKNTDGKKRDAIMLACISRKYFAPHLAATKANPLLWSSGLMSPEAYTLHDALETYISNGTPAQVRASAAKAYAKYQHCSESAASRLLVN